MLRFVYVFSGIGVSKPGYPGARHDCFGDIRV